MNAWLIAATVLLVGLCGPILVALRGELFDALVALELAGVVDTLVLMLLAEGFHRTTLFDPAVVLAVMTFIGALALARFLERWI
jgi:multisubunit Na+/H+ antiporter MnhF subunit